MKDITFTLTVWILGIAGAIAILGLIAVVMGY